MVAAWTAGVGALSAGPGAVTILHGTTFVLSAANGDMEEIRPHGLFFRDTRFVCGWRLRINGKDLEPLSGTAVEPYRAMFVGRIEGTEGDAESHVLVERHRSLNSGFTEQITVHNYSSSQFTATLTVDIDTDFADLFDVKGGLRRPKRASELTVQPHGQLHACELGGHRLALRVKDDRAEGTPSGLRYGLSVPPQGQWTTLVSVDPSINEERPGAEDAPEPEPGYLERPEIRQAAWNRKVPSLKIGNTLVGEVLATSRRDLGTLRIFQPGNDSRAVVAAGAPWFMALFGRDSLLTGFMSLAVDSSLALGTVEALAERQGTQTNPATEEEPGKILHELRQGTSPARELGTSGAYYGSVDSTPLFVTLAGELARWGIGRDTLQRLMPAVDSAMGWIERSVAKDRHGFLAYKRSLPTGLANQGWKDSWDGITFADGTVAAAPLALCEVQGYVYTAYLARALLAKMAGDGKTMLDHARRAARIKEAFNEEFWLPDRGYYALALDGSGRAVDSCASNMGHCLWSGIVDKDKAPAVAARLMDPEMFSGWGVRTLSTRMRAYNPASYHNGSVWPHDNALVAGGLMRYGFVAESQRIAVALMEAAQAFGGRLPELFCGLDRDSHPVPVPYPTSCSPQAWAAATPMHLLRMMLRLDPFLTQGQLFIDPVLPEDWGEVELGNIVLGEGRLSLRATGRHLQVGEVPAGLQVVLGGAGRLADILQDGAPKPPGTGERGR
ncbi:amylo-alpha-1,6-glucosidase [Paeniglutamicibacter psychrophenolicus]|uniref:amylo-alpha-1,6-glucosidase n=1 Tax=Paeniglutamicibacter psychrophenolicus TaxID=257454 RepID=UPI00277D8A5E|nr:glycogen debranching N-terminal domain-containing protein [Paeniglutamicibacter psychrophenolicus]MDQ0096129.1 glycogen debranching enzyme [Paeniglutamicibacter psychrophenolicus]